MNLWMIFSDIHLKEWKAFSTTLSNGLNSRLMEQIKVLQQVKKIARQYKVTNIFFLGDLVDSISPTISKIVINTAFYMIQSLAEVASIYLLVGNHDVFGQINTLTPFSSIPHVKIIDESTAINLDGKTIDLIPCYGVWPKSKSNYCFGHFGIQGATIGDGFSLDEEIKPQLLKDYKLVLCVDETTEALTPEGWRKYDDLVENSIIGTTDKDGIFEWQPIQQMNIYPKFSGNMIHHGGRKLSSIDHFSTENHMMLVRGSNRKWVKREAKSVLNDAWKLRTAASKWNGIFKWEGPLQGSNMDLAEYAGWYVSEGGIGDGRKRECQVSLAQKKSVNRKKYDKIKSLVDRLGLYPSEHPLCIRICNTKLAEWTAKTFGRGHLNKHLPLWVKNWPQKELRHLLSTMINGDGHWISKTCAGYYTTSKQLSEDVQEIAFKIGWTTIVHPRLRKNRNNICYDITIVFNNYRQCPGKKYIRSINYNGLVWCPTTRNGLWISRRNGRVLVTGNSGHYHTRQMVANNAYQIGSVMNMNFSNTPEDKGVFLLNPENDELKFIQIKSPKFYTVKCDFSDQIEEFLRIQYNNYDYFKLILGSDSLLAPESKNNIIVEYDFQPTVIEKELIDTSEIMNLEPIIREYIDRSNTSLDKEILIKKAIELLGM